jgi:hypothetical protein
MRATQYIQSRHTDRLHIVDVLSDAGLTLCGRRIFQDERIADVGLNNPVAQDICLRCHLLSQDKTT